MIYYLDVVLEFIQMGILAGIVWHIRKPIAYQDTAPSPSPGTIFRKPKRKPIALDDEKAYELEQKNRRGPMP